MFSAVQCYGFIEKPFDLEETRNLIKTAMRYHTTDEEIMLPNRTCKKVLEEIDSDEFVMCNRGTIVNMAYIERIDLPDRYLYLKGVENAVEIGSSMKMKFMERFRNR